VPRGAAGVPTSTGAAGRLAGPPRRSRARPRRDAPRHAAGRLRRARKIARATSDPTGPPAPDDRG